MKKLPAGPDYDEFQIDTSFHSYLVDITGNEILINLYQSVMIQQMRLAVYAALKDDQNRVDNLEQHRAIIDALLRENEDAVQDAIILHINHSLIKSLKMMENDNWTIRPKAAAIRNRIIRFRITAPVFFVFVFNIRPLYYRMPNTLNASVAVIPPRSHCGLFSHPLLFQTPSRYILFPLLSE